ncbi:serine/threonine protein phosphatase 1 [Haloarcula vallismortis]|uniref:Serine/threonine protein phosphatase n=2 Tax=Haloarcula vallismortis TaxID=28442 RepID=M0J9B3_HALVA|nr:metallophosphoesterase family protein [Haloarcula vallismortis]EMA05556.1 serine/threonine protein phosphatase [Haloarcula vallismortis ATCC 29715]SDW85922.1 serine/threonine protein phosphatase 1 [Haloarcula vallismortis]
MVAPPTFNPAIDASHRRIHSNEWEDIYVVGDVHGCRATLEGLLSRLDPTPEELVVFVGDLVRKGPDSAGVVDIVRRTPNFITVRGNNEQKLIDGRKSIPSLTDDDLSWIASLPVAISWDDSLVVHGGVDHRKPIAEHELTELLNMRSLVPDGSYDRPYWFETRRDAPRIFFGHTVLSEPFETSSAVGLDTGCVYGGQLTAYRCSTGKFITVDPGTTHEDRSADSIVDPERAPPTSI